MDRFVAKLNVQHFKEMLASESDGAKRERLRVLLAEAEAELTHAERNAAERANRPNSKAAD